jgi:hypothetical protein
MVDVCHCTPMFHLIVQVLRVFNSCIRMNFLMLMEDAVVAITAYARSSVEHYETLFCSLR